MGVVERWRLRLSVAHALPDNTMPFTISLTTCRLLVTYVIIFSSKFMFFKLGAVYNPDLASLRPFYRPQNRCEIILNAGLMISESSSPPSEVTTEKQS